MRKRKISRWTALAAAVVLLALTGRGHVAYGAVGIETGEKCSVTFRLGEDTYGGTQEHPVDYETWKLEDLEIPVKLYRVASVNVSGKYTPVEPFESLSDLASVNADTKADQWQKLADAAWKIAEPGEDGTVQEGAEAAREVLLTNGTGMAEGLDTGLYLVAAQQVLTDEYIFSFQPYLVSLPGNAYDPADQSSSDEWLYEVTVGLKPSRENRYGDLEIQKTLNTYNATLGGATFIFQVEAEKDGIVYSDVVSLVFDGAGTKPVRIEKKIPAGALVTVTELYNGASYQLVSDAVQTQTIVADQTVGVSFVNDYDERLNGGTSVVNHFYQRPAVGRDGSVPAQDTDSAGTGVWDWAQLTDSTEQAGGAANEEESE